MRKCVTACLLVMGLVLGTWAMAHAGAYEFFGTGIRALSIGGAFIGLADDSTATYWNPAGLAQLRGKGIEFDLERDSVDYGDNNSIRNLDPSLASLERNDVFLRWIPTEPDRFNKVKPNIFYMAGDTSAHYRWGENTFGAAFYVPNGNYIDWKDAVSDRTTGVLIRADYYSRFFLTLTNLSVAREILPGVMVGGGANVIYGSFLTKAGKHYLGGNQPGLVNRFGLDSSGSGFGLEGVFGILLKPTHWLSMGAVYRTGSNINVEGRFHVVQGPIRDDIAPKTLTRGYDRVSNYKQDFPLPPTFGAGIALKPLSRLTLTFDIQGADWTRMKTEIDFDEQRRNKVRGEPFPLPNLNLPLDWNLSLRYRMGVEVRVSDRLSLMSGFMYDENAVPDNRSSMTSIIGFEMQAVSLGASYDLGNWKLDLLYNYHQYAERVEGRKILGHDNLVGFGLSRHF